MTMQKSARKSIKSKETLLSMALTFEDAQVAAGWHFWQLQTEQAEQRWGLCRAGCRLGAGCSVELLR